MVEYKPGIEYAGWRYALARVRELWHRWRLTRKSIVGASILVTVCALLYWGYSHTGSRYETQMCLRCGHMREIVEDLQFGIASVRWEKPWSDGWLTEWIVARKGPCKTHRWRTTWGQSNMGDCSADYYRIHGWPLLRDAARSVFLQLAAEDVSRAESLADAILDEDGLRARFASDWLEDLAQKQGDAPSAAELVASFDDMMVRRLTASRDELYKSYLAHNEARTQEQK